MVPVPEHGLDISPDENTFTLEMQNVDSGRSTALAGAGCDSHSRADDLQDGLEINRRTSEVRGRSQTFPVRGHPCDVPDGGGC